tara:strand:- start:4 stop:1209 length:1206 start_codon:yes stop_codon:yes gene_type:complete
MKILYCILFTLIIFSLLKKKKEKFLTKTKEELTLSFSNMDSIFMITKILKYIEQSEKGTKIFKTKNLIHSNKSIYSESGEFTGFIFSIKKGDRLEIGFSNMEKDKKNQLTHGFDIIDDSSFRIKEKNKSDNYSVQDLDFCKLVKMDTCFNSKNLFKFDPEKNLLAIVLNKNRANYFIIKRNVEALDEITSESGYGSMLIHRGILPLRFPYKLKVITKDMEALLPTLLWMKHDYSYSPAVSWIVETKFKDEYNNAPFEIVPMKTTDKEELPAPSPIEKEKEIDLSKFFDDGIRKIIIQDLEIDNSILNVLFKHNLNNTYLNLNDNKIFIKFILDDDTYIFRKVSIDKIEKNEFNKKLKMFLSNIRIKIFRIFKSIEIKIGDVNSYQFSLNKDEFINFNPTSS